MNITSLQESLLNSSKDRFFSHSSLIKYLQTIVCPAYYFSNLPSYFTNLKAKKKQPWPPSPGRGRACTLLLITRSQTAMFQPGKDRHGDSSKTPVEKVVWLVLRTRNLGCVSDEHSRHDEEGKVGR